MHACSRHIHDKLLDTIITSNRSETPAPESMIANPCNAAGQVKASKTEEDPVVAPSATLPLARRLQLLPAAPA